MRNVVWSSIRYPLKTTIIDCETGKPIGHYTNKELEELKTDNQ